MLVVVFCKDATMSKNTAGKNMKNKESDAEDAALSVTEMISSTCGCRPKLSDIVTYRQYYWHSACFDRDTFPSGGKLIPKTIMTDI